MPPGQFRHGSIPLRAPSKFVSTKYGRNKRAWIVNNCFVVSLNPSKFVHDQLMNSHILCNKAHTNNMVVKVPAGTGIHNQDNRAIISLGAMSFHLKFHFLLFFA
ncbi:Os03g0719700 [Oryza sativa Japonica Group]|uniref:Os03g0719700 protein n=2 Tax=Oryza sativa subsp. japonica TaxID=39947 RepID=Q0DP27_ORYSJ|nr:hypothetical protein EE612_020093 [Oryza sativa]BAF13011.1 Os03g0719700 [Oryza sativa Japonica Group]BAS86113.1 Os03g0719700 [Oryza sativa Japonica Group]|eukprot:NP_001051097.1 Os03g0719700 [Oryza sativa Japonica Group]